MVSPEFELATLEVQHITGSISNDDLLQFYAYYKIAHGEDFSQAKAPGAFDFKNKYKYNAWKKEHDAGLSSAEAEKKYIELADKCKEKHGIDPSATKSANGAEIKADQKKRFNELVQQLGRTY